MAPGQIMGDCWGDRAGAAGCGRYGTDRIGKAAGSIVGLPPRLPTAAGRKFPQS